MKGITCNSAIEAEGFRTVLQEAGIESTIYDETNSKVARGILDRNVDVLVKEEDMVLKVGDQVLYGKYAGTELELEGKKYLIMRQSDVVAILG